MDFKSENQISQIPLCSCSSSEKLIQELLEQLTLANNEILRLRFELGNHQQALQACQQQWAQENSELHAQLKTQVSVTEDILESSGNERDTLQKQISVHLEEKEALVSQNAEIIEFIYEDSQAHFEHLQRNYELLLEDVLKRCAVNISQWKADYEIQTKKQLNASDDGSSLSENDTNDLSLARIWKAFKGMKTSSKVLIVIGIVIIVIVLGVVAWKFIVWAWPMLIHFAASIDIPSCIGSGINFLSSDACIHLLHAWQAGQPLSLSLVKGFGSELLPNFLKMAPLLLSLIRGSKG